VSNNFNGGVQAGNYMVKALAKVKGTKQIAISALDPSITVGVERVNGFLSVMKAHKDFKVVTNLNGNNTTPGGFSVVKNALTAHPKIAGVFTANDPMGAGASQAIGQAKKTGKIVLVSFNGDPFALDMVLKGTINATIAQDPYGQGVSAVDAAAALLKCEAPKYTKPAVKTLEYAVSVITKANAAALKAKNAQLAGAE
jgi:ribose transport system substrate-binding protein